jgi:hypothetical protein
MAVPGISPQFRTYDGTPIDIWTLTPSDSQEPFPVTLSCELGDAIEQMARLLPSER